MRDMGVLNTEQLKNESAQGNQPVQPDRSATNSGQQKVGALRSDMNMPTDFQYKPESLRPATTDADVLRNLGAGLRDVGPYLVPQAHQLPSFQQLNTKSDELDVAAAAHALNVNSSS